MKDIKKIIGKRIASERKKQKLSQEELAELANLHPTYISTVERGKSNIGIENIYKIAMALNIKLEILFKNI